MQSISSSAATTIANNFKFNGGNELNDKFEINYYETYLRNYDAQIGRFTGIDILSEQQASLTPYQYGNNDPIFYNDPLGDRYKAPMAYGNSVDEISNIALANQGMSPYLTQVCSIALWQAYLCF